MIKFPIVLRKTYENKVNELQFEIDRKNGWYMEQVDLCEDLKTTINFLDNRNRELNRKNVFLESKSNKYQDWYRNITVLYKDSQNDLNEKDIELQTVKRELQTVKRELEGLKKKYNALENINTKSKKKIDDYKHDIVVFGKIYNNMNRKLWCNDESKRQLRNLADSIRDAERINKNDIARYLEEISFRVGGGEPFKFTENIKEIADDVNA